MAHGDISGASIEVVPRLTAKCGCSARGYLHFLLAHQLPWLCHPPLVLGHDAVSGENARAPSSARPCSKPCLCWDGPHVPWPPALPTSLRSTSLWPPGTSASPNTALP